MNTVLSFRYCVNESVNLIVSSYANQAAVNHIPMQISITATEFSRFQITDLCSLFANALENALHACQQMNPQSQRYISLKVYEKNTQLCIQIKNSYEQPVVFADDIPISRSVNHGIGVQSMISVVEKNTMVSMDSLQIMGNSGFRLPCNI